MTYHFETLGDERFQQLCQALLTKAFPNVQCLPVGQPDGGRDGFQRSQKTAGEELVIFQVKFAKDPSSKEERDSIESLIRSEQKKVEKMVARGAASYYLLTNVRGTSHLDCGSIDSVNAALSSAFSIPSYCWWRDDLERRIDALHEVKWSYPEMLRATDVLAALLNSGSDDDVARRSDVIRSYMALQAKLDDQLKFKQIELRKSMLDLFVDLPAQMIASPGVSKEQHSREWQKYIEDENLGTPSPEDERGPDECFVGAIELLVKNSFAKRIERLVVEGAPGQGKSTVTQYLCQVNRYLLLGKSEELAKVDARHRPNHARIPFRVDLRDYATWLTGKNPFSEASSGELPPGATAVLESFISEQVHNVTGSNFTVDDLNATLKSSAVLIVLDGFDEVADIYIRNRIVSEVSNAHTRISANALSLQIIVTSRPSAFANSPGFPRDEWSGLQILPLTPGVMEIYAKRWLDARDIEKREASNILAILTQKLHQPHVRELARNPMQLAILLTLISVQGQSLPDRRTTLYDSYIEIFLNRESEKSEVVRDNRELLVQIHRYLAWILQSEAEEKSGSGNISESRLKDVLKNYLSHNDHPVELVEKLFSGMVERVVALVSRVQGTFEFEVQPLREYFAARHLYDTAPYAPASSASRGSKPDRFAAIASNFYWLNVCRFYAGCYTSGELASIIDGIDELREKDLFAYTGHTAQLAMDILNDHVFSQSPKLARKLTEGLLAHKAFRIHIAESRFRHRASYASIPAYAGRSPLLELIRTCARSSMPEERSLVSNIALANLSDEERLELWNSEKSNLSNDSWLELGFLLGIYRSIPVDAAAQLIDQNGPSVSASFVMYERFDVFEERQDLLKHLLQNFTSTCVYLSPWMHIEPDAPPALRFLADLAMLISPYSFREFSPETEETTVAEAICRRYMHPRTVDRGAMPSEAIVQMGYSRVFKATDNILSMEASAFPTAAEMWTELVDSCIDAWGDSWHFSVAALNFASEICELPRPAMRFLDPTELNTSPATFAIQASHYLEEEKWIEKILPALEGASLHRQMFAMACVLRWSSTETLISHQSEISRALARFSEVDFGAVFHRSDANDGPKAINVRAEVLTDDVSARFATILMRRLKPASQKLVWNRYLRDYCGEDHVIWDTTCSYAIQRAKGNEGRWSSAMDMVKTALSKGSPYYAYEGSAEFSGEGIPNNVAKRICMELEEYPLSIVGAAATTLRRVGGLEVVPVGKIAERDSWFA